jgi:hypothetical protein
MVNMNISYFFAVTLLLTFFSSVPQSLSQSLSEQLNNAYEEESLIYKEDGVELDLESISVEGVDLDDAVGDASEEGLLKSSDTVQQEYYNSLPFSKIKPLYTGSSYTELTSIYWKMGLLDTENAVDVSAFLLLSQCKKVKPIFYDDFKWRDLRGKGREYLINNKEKFGSKVSFVQPKKLRNYNFDSQSFEVDPAFSYRSVRRLRITNNYFERRHFCVDFPEMQEYIKRAPYNIVLSLPTSFSFFEVPMSPEISKLYLNYIKEADRERIVYVKFYSSFAFYKESIYNINVSGGFLADMSGTIDYVEVFADPEMRRLLYRRDYRND